MILRGNRFRPIVPHEVPVGRSTGSGGTTRTFSLIIAGLAVIDNSKRPGVQLIAELTRHGTVRLLQDRNLLV
jgi:hypothetical protein